MLNTEKLSLAERPHSSEAAPYFLAYINQVASDDIVATLGSQLDETFTWCATIAEEKSLHRYAADKWSIRQALNHVTDTERALAFRALWFGRGFDTPLPSYDQEIAAAGAQADGLSWAAHVEEFRNVRLSTISLFQNMPPEAWLRGGIASGQFVTVRALAWIIAGHLTHHVAILRERYL